MPENDNKRNGVHYMPLHHNTKAKNNMVVQGHLFADSDYYECHSMHQGKDRQPHFKGRVGSTVSPVSSRSRNSGLLR